MSKNNKQKVFSGSNYIIWCCLLFSVAFAGLYGLVDLLLDDYPQWLGLALFGFLAFTVLIVFFVYKKKRDAEIAFENKTLQMEKAMTGLMKDVDIPCILTLPSGIIAWCSKGAYKMFNTHESLLQKNINDLCDVKVDELIETLNEDEIFGNINQGSLPVTILGRKYVAQIHRQTLGKNSYYLITYTDHTEYSMLLDKYEAETPVVAHIVLDNLNEIAEYVRVSYRAAANQIEEILTQFAADMNGFIREYNRDKYIMVFSKEKYKECLENKFEILETIRNVRLGDSSVPVTISMGVSTIGDNFEEKEKNAFSALEFALQRGGDQVAVKTENDIVFYGGRTKGVQKKSGSFARVFATQLVSHIANAGNVLIMGHSNPDFDAIGACVGIARLCMWCGVEPKIVMNTQHKNFEACTEKLLMLEDYKNTFVSAEAGLDLIQSNTLLIIVDANNFNILESSDIAYNVADFIVIDHHRKVAEFENEPLLALIDPSASSASEMITNILEQCLPNDILYKEEANLLLSGIMVDTKNFTKTTGTKTFSAAMYLRGIGANSEIAGTFFHEDFEDFLTEAKFNTNVTMYLDKIAITESNGNDPSFDRVAAAKAADKLLNVRGVEASFALVSINDRIHISARSNGNVNVQLILEKMGGGGHFDSAAAAVSGNDMKAVLYRLKDAIDQYFAEN
ncbi:MAG: DHH family phosphoesterase [Clostridia bacterium]|nr:DHH family phosphoesterase [Clostridia bacterium]